MKINAYEKLLIRNEEYRGTLYDEWNLDLNGKPISLNEFIPTSKGIPKKMYFRKEIEFNGQKFCVIWEDNPRQINNQTLKQTTVEIVPYLRGAQSQGLVCLHTSFHTMHPELSKELKLADDLSLLNEENEKVLNKKDGHYLKPWSIAPKSHKTVIWKCLHGHEDYAATIASRTNMDSGCPKCHHQKSSHEFRLEAELKYLFSDADIDGFSILKFYEQAFRPDILIKHLKIIIEFDGYQYHKDVKNIKKDKRLTNMYTKEGYSVVRVRDEGLDGISKAKNIFIKKRDKLLKATVEELFIEILNVAEIKGYKELILLRKKVAQYIKEPGYANKEIYRELKYIFSNQPVNSFLKCFPQHEKNYCTKNTRPFKSLSVNTNDLVEWICNKGHKFSRVVSHMKVELNCSVCKQVQYTHPELLSFMDKKYLDVYKKLSRGSSKKIKCICPVCGEDFDRVMNKLSSGRLNCKNKKGKYGVHSLLDGVGYNKE